MASRRENKTDTPLVVVVIRNHALRKKIRELIQAAGFSTAVLVNLEGARTALRRRPELIVLDFEVAQKPAVNLKRQFNRLTGTTAVLYIKQPLTIKEESKTLNLIHEDFIVDPLNPDEFTIRIKTLLKRVDSQQKQIIHWNGVSVDVKNRKASFQRTDLFLTVTEFAILQMLIESRGDGVARKLIAQRIRPSQIEKLRFVDRHVCTLRGKLAAASGPGIHRVQGVGYRLGSRIRHMEIQLRSPAA